jgi:hypothetical protein
MESQNPVVEWLSYLDMIRIDNPSVIPSDMFIL